VIPSRVSGCDQAGRGDGGSGRRRLLTTLAVGHTQHDSRKRRHTSQRDPGPTGWAYGTTGIFSTLSTVLVPLHPVPRHAGSFLARSHGTLRGIQSPPLFLFILGDADCGSPRPKAAKRCSVTSRTAQDHRAGQTSPASTRCCRAPAAWHRRWTAAAHSQLVRDRNCRGNPNKRCTTRDWTQRTHTTAEYGTRRDTQVGRLNSPCMNGLRPHRHPPSSDPKVHVDLVLHAAS